MDDQTHIRLDSTYPGIDIVPTDNGTQLVIESMSKTDIGKYICEASDGIETISTFTNVFLYGLLRFFVLY